MIIRKEGLEHIIGKKVGDVITEDTKILTEFVDGYEIRDKSFRKGNLSIESYENLSVLTDFDNNIVICFKDDKPVCLFNVYEVANVYLNGKRGMVTAQGHETAHEYWFDDGEYNKQHTR